MGQRITATDGKDVFSEWVKGFTARTVDIYLCRDVELLHQRDSLLDEVGRLEAEAAVEATYERSLVDSTPTAALLMKEKEEELKALEEKIREASDALETTCPSEDELLSIGNYQSGEISEDEWGLRLVALAIKRSDEEARALRKVLPRATWMFIVVQIMAEHLNSNLTADFLSKSSGSTPAS